MNSDELAHKQLEKELLLYKNMINNSLDSITLIDRNYTYCIVTDAFIKARQLCREEVLNHSVADVWGKDIFEQVIKERLDACFAGNTISHVAAYEFNKNEINYIETIYSPCFTSGPEPSHAVVLSHNITELKKSEQRIESLAFYDPLTKLPSRPLFYDYLHHELIKAKRSGLSVAVFFFDLDEFKKTNDSLGHSAGDELLVAVSQRLKKFLRQSDIIGRPGGVIKMDAKNHSEFLARVGGDEFTFMIPDISDELSVTTIAERILSTFNEPHRIADREVYISTSIGIALYPRDGDDVETLLKKADAAMYEAKETGKNTFSYYSSKMNQRAKERVSMASKLQNAMQGSEFELYYQPQYNIQNSELAGMEALIRWKNNDMGLVYPNDFIPLAEETGMMVEIGDWALLSACHQGKLWQDQGFSLLKLGVNLSIRQFFDPNLMDKLQSVLSTTRFDPTCLEFEITENVIIHDAERVSSIVKQLRMLGIKLALDDFGTGRSSLLHLKSVPFDTVKIDQVFIRNADINGRDGAIITSIIDMCHNLGIRPLAEGVETLEVLNFLKEKRCHSVQGFFFSPPLPVGKAQDLFRGLAA